MRLVRALRLTALAFAVAFALPAAARVALFQSSGFPAVDASPIAPAVLQRAFKGLPLDTLSVPEDFKQLQVAGDRVLVLPYGSAFPIDAWPSIRDYLKGGGNLVVLGGAPFYQPVRRSADGVWVAGTRQPSFAHELLIGPAEAVAVESTWSVALPNRDWKTAVAAARTVWELTVRLATRSTIAGEQGSEGEREGVVRPLVHLVSSDGVPRACPLVEIDRLRGAGKGGRWIFATSDAPLDASAIRTIVLRALEGASELDARPEIASVAAGETPAVRINVLRPRPLPSDAVPARAGVIVRDAAGKEVWRGGAELSGAAETRTALVKIASDQRLAPGLYDVRVTAGALAAATGFWVRDDALLAKGPRLSVSRDWLRRDGKVFPVIGTTYMASDVHRQFLFEPNPGVWDRDFEQMASLGINFVRTGLWTGWSRAMAVDGTPALPLLRSLEAYVLSAARHGIVVNFTFFAFLPPAFGGTNPYLDPRSLEGQQKFVGGIARQFRGVGWIHYDLINEPSYAPPEGLWSNRPIGDEWERRAWLDWVRQRHGDDAAGLRERWGVAADDVLDLPRQSDLYYAQIREDRHPRKTRDFTEFSQEVVARWAAKLRETIRAAGGDVLVTLGQDEGGTATRPSQQLHAEAVDYTCIHPWWQNDDVLANGLFAKVPEKPALFQETGLMRLEDVGGSPWRSPSLAAEALGRKFVYAFAARSAGAVEWAWNINPIMPIDNESVIGFFRPDGTAKPELAVVPKLSAFFGTAAPWLDDFEPEPVVVVIPQARLFLARPAATDGTRRLVRVLAERFGVVPAAVSDLALTPQRLSGARLVIVPSPEVLDARAADVLAGAMRGGTKVLMTGAFTGDSYGAAPAGLDGLRDAGRPVRYREVTGWGEGIATFDANLQESLLCSTQPSSRDFAEGVWREPLPLEHAREDAPLIALLTAALARAGVGTHPSTAPVALHVLAAPRALLAVAVNETGRDVQRPVDVSGRMQTIGVRAGGWALVLFDRATGDRIARVASDDALPASRAR